MNWNLWTDPTLVWFFVGLICVILEFILPGVIIVFFGIGAWVVSLITWVLPIHLFLQIFIFIFISITGLVMLRKRFNPPADMSRPDITDEFIGKIAVITEAVSKDMPGRVRFKGAEWQAQTNLDEILEKDRRVRIARRENITLFVESLNE